MSDDLVKGAAWSLNTLMPIAEKQQAEIEKLRRQVDILREGTKVKRKYFLIELISKICQKRFIKSYSLQHTPNLPRIKNKGE